MDEFFTEQSEPVFGEAQLAAAKGSGKIGQSEEEGQLTVDVYQTDDDIIIKSTIAGVTSDDIDIAVTNDMVTIKGTRKPDEKIKQDNYYYQELYWGPFSRSVILPEEIDSDNAKASMKNGILTVKLPKLAKTRIKKVKIST